ncbi:MAG TPA: glycine zipper 2TM domain-containing protein [Burkholderiales bacterium]|jgi:outer membrane lipoprotein SlyB
METQQKSRIHPLAAGAAVAVIIASAVGVAAMTGHLPGSSAEPAAAQVAAAPPPPAPAVPAETAEHRAAREQGAREQIAREQAARDRARHQQLAEASQQPRCASCGVVESVNAVQQKGQGGAVGMVGGGVAGALVGSQIGHGGGKTVAELAGAAGGAFLGNEIQKKVTTTTRYDVVVRLEGGGAQTVSYAAQPGFSVGSRVRVENGALVQN